VANGIKATYEKQSAGARMWSVLGIKGMFLFSCDGRCREPIGSLSRRTVGDVVMAGDYLVQVLSAWQSLHAEALVSIVPLICVVSLTVELVTLYPVWHREQLAS